MPTLISTSIPVNQPPQMSPAELILSFGGVDFVLTPSDNAAELSYRNNGQGVLLSLTSFTGSLQVSLRGGRPTIMPTTATVEEEPHSPGVTQKSPNVSPRQQQLPFQKPSKTGKGASKSVTNKNTEHKPKERKRAVDAKAPRAPVKKSRRDESQEIVRNAPEKLPAAPGFPSMCQTMEATQATQAMPDLSQTVDSSDQSGNEARSGSDTGMFRIHSADKPKTSVQEILDRVNSSNDSVATVRDDDENSIASNAADKSFGLITEEKSDAGDQPASGATSSAVVPTLESNSPLKGYPPPCPRWGHSMTKVKGNRLLIYGGQSFDSQGNTTILSDVHVFDISKRTWSKPINCRGEARQWHSATLLPERQLIISFGGESMDPNKKNKVITSDTLRVLDTDIMLWYPPAVSGDIPTGRSGHTATLLPNTNELVLFGGVKGSKWLNTVSILDIGRWIWTTPKNVQGSAPKPRSYHSATAVKGHGSSYKLVIFGGNNKTSCFNSVHVLETKENEWKWSHPTVTSQPPFPRTGHSATLLDDGKTICIYGGWDPNSEDSSTGEDHIFKFSHLLDTETWTWSKGPKALPGGSGSEDTVVTDFGSKRCGHTSVLNPENGEVMMFGGRTPGEVLAGDFQRLPFAEKAVGLDEK